MMEKALNPNPLTNITRIARESFPQPTYICPGCYDACDTCNEKRKFIVDKYKIFEWTIEGDFPDGN